MQKCSESDRPNAYTTYAGVHALAGDLHLSVSSNLTFYLWFPKRKTVFWFIKGFLLTTFTLFIGGHTIQEKSQVVMIANENNWKYSSDKVHK